MFGKYEYFNGEFSELLPNEIFVFGSNLGGIHGSGAAKVARYKFGAVWGQGIGFTGNCYAIPTKDHQIKTLPLLTIKKYVNLFKAQAALAVNKKFIVTQIGCGLAGYAAGDIAPMFIDSPENCIFDEAWKEYLEPEVFDYDPHWDSE